MKTLGQIAYEAAYPEFEQWADWSDPTNVTGKRWEAAAQAVRAAVIEECLNKARSLQWTGLAGRDAIAREIGNAIESLKIKQEGA